MMLVLITYQPRGILITVAFLDVELLVSASF